MSAATTIWYIRADKKLYGPYNEAQMRAFAVEGRLSASSLVSHERDGDFYSAGDDSVLGTLLRQSAGAVSVQTAQPAPRRFVIFTRISTASRGAFVAQLSQFGVAIEAMDNIWLLQAPVQVHRLRNILSKALGGDDALFIADTSQGDSAWFNLGQAMDSRLRQFWEQSQ